MRDGKDIENRSRPTSYRGPLLIHVSRKPESPEAGMIIGVVDLVDCLSPGDIFAANNPWAEAGFYHWVLKNPRRFRTGIPARGKLALWDYPLDPVALKRLS